MKINVGMKHLKDINEIPIILEKQQTFLNELDEKLSEYTINRYLITPLIETEIEKISMAEWFYKNQLILSENNNFCTFSEYEDFILFLQDYAKSNYEIEFSDNESVFSDYQYIEFLLYISYIKELDKLKQEYCNCLKVEKMSLADYVITTFGMYFTDELPLNSFINILLELHLKFYLTENIKKMKKGENYIYDISSFKTNDL